KSTSIVAKGFPCPPSAPNAGSPERFGGETPTLFSNEPAPDVPKRFRHAIRNRLRHRYCATPVTCRRSAERLGTVRLTYGAPIMRPFLAELLRFGAAVATVSLLHAEHARAETKLAAILPLTGNAADQGEWARRGFQIALEQLQPAED